MGIPRIMNGVSRHQAPPNKLAEKPYSGGKGYETKPISNSGMISDDGRKDYGV